MQQQNNQGQQASKRPIGRTTPLWSVNAMAVASGFLIGATAGLHLAKPFFDDGQPIPGAGFTAFAIIISLIPVFTLMWLHKIEKAN